MDDAADAVFARGRQHIQRAQRVDFNDLMNVFVRIGNANQRRQMKNDVCPLCPFYLTCTMDYTRVLPPG